MPEQVPSVGRVVHFVYGDEHYAAMITAVREGESEQTLVVFPPMDPPFTTVAAFDAKGAPATWHWLEPVAAKGGA